MTSLNQVHTGHDWIDKLAGFSSTYFCVWPALGSQLSIC